MRKPSILEIEFAILLLIAVIGMLTGLKSVLHSLVGI